MDKKNTIVTKIPGMPPIEMISWYEQFEDYYLQCEMATKEWFVQNVMPDWNIMDCGANIGYYSILFSRLTHGKIWAFEPTSTIEMLQQNLSYNEVNNVDVFRIALGKKTGIHEDSIYKIWGEKPEYDEYRFTTIDHFVLEFEIKKLDCIKIDVDSFDFEVLQGAIETIKSLNPIIVVELNHALSKRNQSNSQALEWMREQGYTDTLCLDYENFIFIKNRKFESNKFIKVHF